jgi:DNA invertase Pin-like site-specific DNA recombinase
MILCFEASRLSRNSKDWAQLFELCGLLATLVADLDQVYDLSLPDDRLILGVKGSISEYELSLFRQRSEQAIRAKAQRGALHFTLPAGLGGRRMARSSCNRIGGSSKRSGWSSTNWCSSAACARC